MAGMGKNPFGRVKGFGKSPKGSKSPSFKPSIKKSKAVGSIPIGKKCSEGDE